MMPLTINIPQSVALRSSRFRPSHIPGLVLWLDAADAATLTLDGSNNVSQWSDKSGFGNHATQSTDTLRPAYLTDGINGMPALRGDGSDDIMTWTQFASGTNHNFYVVAQYDTGINSWANSFGFMGTAATNSPGHNIQISGALPTSSPVVFDVSGVGSTTFISSGASPHPGSGIPAVYSMLRNGGLYRGKWTYGEIASRTGTGSFVTTATRTNRIFSARTGPASFRIAELVCYSRDLDQSQESALSRYFQGKYGVGI